MKNKCFFCNKIVNIKFYLTETRKDGTTETCNMCEKCGEIYMREHGIAGVARTPVDDLIHITTPEELLELIEGRPSGEICNCGMNEFDFEEHGRFGCPECYSKFKQKIEQYVYPFHGARYHCGKKPKVHYIEAIMQDPIEKMKVLKLRYAQALELEHYEKAALIKKEINELIEQLPSASSDQ